MQLNTLYTILLWIVLGSLAIAIARQLSEKRGIYLLPDSWGTFFARYGQEGFATQNVKPEVEGVPSPTYPLQAGEPADAYKANSYSILADVMPMKETKGDLTASTCFASDFLAQSDKVGNYIQRTNNIRQARPDSCTAPRTELVNSFYTNVAI